MGVFEDVIIKAKTAADMAGRKTGEIVEIAKLRLSASELEGKISREFLELGKKVYSAAKERTDCTDYVHSKAETIDRLYEELKTLNDRISELKSEKRCKCGFANPEDANYCQKCGEKL